ncbi:MAG: 5'/3'-nucleotidase SurE [Actinomycetota bacterium]|nr:5'/3'-nucleotidase SurE [Actinomycetota bacterium]
MAEIVMVTNDDGIDSPGLLALAVIADRAGGRTLVAAPLAEASGTSAGLTAAHDRRSVVSEQRTLADLPDVTAYGVGAHPALITLVACRGGFGDVPDVVLSGINRGANIGRAVLHSGTVGAALTASVNGISALAVSLDVETDHHGPMHWDTAARVVADLFGKLLECPPGTVLNVNVPNVPFASLDTPKWARLADFGAVQSTVQRLEDGTIEVASIAVDTELESGTDAALLAQGHATVTALRSVAQDGDVHDGFDLG